MLMMYSMLHVMNVPLKHRHLEQGGIAVLPLHTVHQQNVQGLSKH